MTAPVQVQHHENDRENRSVERHSVTLPDRDDADRIP